LKATPGQIIEHFHEIDLKSPADVIIQQIKELVSSGVLRPGDRLPPERALAERFGVGRGHIREAIKRLESYGILKTIPQSGTIVGSLGAKALEGLITKVLHLEKDDFQSLLETRALLEIQAAKLAATRASEAEIEELERTHEEFCRQAHAGGSGLEEDLRFHLKIAECARNSVLRSLITLFTTDIVTLAKSHETAEDGRFVVALREHEAVLEGIRSRDPERAAIAMEEHIRKVRLQVESYLPRQPSARPA
jgi:GntR family transcriptional regulator, transcriptional repressor for pyruvate dehydrogenase complex